MLKNYLLATRPKTLVAAVIPPIIAHCFYVFKYDQTSYYYLSLCLIGSILIQIATNFYNDAIDSLKGADDKRVGPKRMSASGELSPISLKRAGHLLNLCVLGIGYLIYLRGGWPFVIIGITSMYLSYGYTGGFFPLAYIGLGEIFVLLYFGLIAVCGSYYLFALELNYEVFILGAQIGLLSTTLIMINNFRDRHTDFEVGKRTLATRMDTSLYLNLFYVALVLPHFLQFFFVYHIRSLLTIIALPMMLKVHSTIAHNTTPKAMNDALKFCAIHLLLFGVLSGIGFLL